MSSERPEVSRPGRYAIAFTVFALLALIWPIYPLFGGIRPMILGMPLSLVLYRDRHRHGCSS